MSLPYLSKPIRTHLGNAGALFDQMVLVLPQESRPAACDVNRYCFKVDFILPDLN
jgi:hypothetical protein